MLHCTAGPFLHHPVSINNTCELKFHTLDCSKQEGCWKHCALTLLFMREANQKKTGSKLGGRKLNWFLSVNGWTQQSSNNQCKASKDYLTDKLKKCYLSRVQRIKIISWKRAYLFRFSHCHFVAVLRQLHACWCSNWVLPFGKTLLH